MWIVGVVALILLVVLVPRIRTLRRGSRLTSELIDGNFGNSEISQQLAAYFREEPHREVQRQRFVELATAMGCPSGLTAEHVMRSVMRAWKEPAMPYGRSLAEEIDELIVFDKPTTPAQESSQRDARAKLDHFKSQIRQLD